MIRQMIQAIIGGEASETLTFNPDHSADADQSSPSASSQPSPISADFSIASNKVAQAAPALQFGSGSPA
jgi:hypothetical protein